MSLLGPCSLLPHDEEPPAATPPPPPPPPTPPPPPSCSGVARLLLWVRASRWRVRATHVQIRKRWGFCKAIALSLEFCSFFRTMKPKLVTFVGKMLWASGSINVEGDIMRCSGFSHKSYWEFPAGDCQARLHIPTRPSSYNHIHCTRTCGMGAISGTPVKINCL